MSSLCLKLTGTTWKLITKYCLKDSGNCWNLSDTNLRLNVKSYSKQLVLLKCTNLWAYSWDFQTKPYQTKPGWLKILWLNVKQYSKQLLPLISYCFMGKFRSFTKPNHTKPSKSAANSLETIVSNSKQLLPLTFYCISQIMAIISLPNRKRISNLPFWGP